MAVATQALPVHRLGSSLRCREARATLSAVEPLMPSLGISRVTDITRMDRLGLPVHASVRPRSRTVHVHAGKGIHPLESRVGALMEALELAVAEPHATPWRRRRAPLRELLDELPGGLGIFDLSPRLDASSDLGRLAEAVCCEELNLGRQAWLPAELVFVPFEPESGGRVFGWSSNGLASGNSIDEATLHALLEVLERDAIAMNTLRDASRWVPHASLPAPFDSLAERWRGLGVALSVRQVPNAFGLPCFVARLHEALDMPVDVAEGAGLHFDRGIALARAICEAAQSRLSHIHGGRDDVAHFFEGLDAHRDAGRRARRSEVVESLFDPADRIEFDAVPDIDTRGISVEALLQWLLDRLKELGFGQVFRHRFVTPFDQVQVVKIVVARCEELESSLQRAGSRLIAQVMARG